jgi:hypothetical protein
VKLKCTVAGHTLGLTEPSNRFQRNLLRFFLTVLMTPASNSAFNREKHATGNLPSCRGTLLFSSLEFGEHARDVYTRLGGFHFWLLQLSTTEQSELTDTVQNRNFIYLARISGCRLQSR